jgi:hypothetical protein
MGDYRGAFSSGREEYKTFLIAANNFVGEVTGDMNGSLVKNGRIPSHLWEQISLSFIGFRSVPGGIESGLFYLNAGRKQKPLKY